MLGAAVEFDGVAVEASVLAWLISGAIFFARLGDGFGGAEGLALGADGLSPVAVALPLKDHVTYFDST